MRNNKNIKKPLIIRSISNEIRRDEVNPYKSKSLQRSWYQKPTAHPKMTWAVWHKIMLSLLNSVSFSSQEVPCQFNLRYSLLYTNFELIIPPFLHRRQRFVFSMISRSCLTGLVHRHLTCIECQVKSRSSISILRFLLLRFGFSYLIRWWVRGKYL